MQIVPPGSRRDLLLQRLKQFIGPYLRPPKIEATYDVLEYAVKDQKHLDAGHFTVSEKALERGRQVLIEKYESNRRVTSRHVDQELTRQANSKRFLYNLIQVSLIALGVVIAINQARPISNILLPTISFVASIASSLYYLSQFAPRRDAVDLYWSQNIPRELQIDQMTHQFFPALYEGQFLRNQRNYNDWLERVVRVPVGLMIAGVLSILFLL